MTVLTVVIATDGNLATLRPVLHSLEHQTSPRDRYEVLVVDDGSTDGTDRWCAGWKDGGSRRHVRQNRCGTAPARNLGLLMARSPLVLFLDDDEVADAELLDEHVRAHAVFPDPESAIVGQSTWRCNGTPTALMHYLAMVEPPPYAYPSTPRELAPSAAHFRTRHMSVTRSFLAQRGLHAAHVGLLADVELGCRLVRHGLRVRYWSHARSERLTAFTFDEWCEQLRREGRAAAALAAVHDRPDIRARARVAASVAEWGEAQDDYESWRTRTRLIEAELGPGFADHTDEVLLALWHSYAQCFAASRSRGVAEGDAARLASRPPS